MAELKREDCNIKSFESWLTEQELSRNTRRSYLDSINLFFQKYEKLSKGSLLDYKEHLLYEGLTPATINLRLSGINKFCEYSNLDTVAVKRIKVQKPYDLDNVINREEYDRLLSCLLNSENFKYYFLFRFLGETGARISEALQLKKKHLYDEFCDVKSKGKHRRIFIPGKYCEAALRYYSDYAADDYLFQNRSGIPLSPRAADLMLEKCSCKWNFPRNVMHCHSFRHFFAIEFLKRNKDIAFLSELLGHSNVNTTAIYLKLSRNEQQARINATVNW